MTARVVLMVAALLGLLCACGSSSSIDADYATFSSVDQLGRTADVVVVGTVRESLGTEVDGGGDSEEGQDAGMQMEFFSVSVDDVLLGKPSNPVVVAWPDTGKVKFEGATPVKAGEQLLLFLRSRDHQSAPGIESFDQFYVPVSGDIGVFDIDDDLATARSEVVKARNSDDSATSAARLEVPLARVKALLVRESSAAGG